MAAKETIQVLRKPPHTDSLDDPPDAPEPFDVKGCVVVPLMNSGEETFQGQIVNADFFVKAPKGTQIIATDRVTIRGGDCAVEGAPADYGRKGVLFQARRTGTV